MLTEIQLDALREVTNIGCGAAATALSQLLSGRRIELEVTRSAVLTTDELVNLLGGTSSSRAAVLVTLRGGFEGRMLLAYDEGDAANLADTLAGAAATTGARSLSDVGRSVIMEVGNIVASAFLNAVGKVSGMILLPSVPSLVHGDIEEVVKLLGAPYEQKGGEASSPPGKLLVLETRLSAGDGPGFDGHLIIVPRPEALGLLFRAVGID